MKKMQQGFTLIELMIVVAIIAILAAIALPAYQDYVARSQVSEAASLASGARTAVAEQYANVGSFASINNTTAGLSAAASISGQYVTQVSVSGGNVDATMGNQASAKVSGGVLRFSPIDRGGSVEWACKGQSGNLAGTSNAKYLPSACR